MRLFACTVSLLALLAVGSAQAALSIDITEGTSGAWPIAIVPFANEGLGQLPVDIAKIVDNDLGGTGQFKPLPQSQMLAQPSKAQEVNYANWRTVEVDNLVVGSVTPDGRGGYRIGFQILDVYKEKSVNGYQITANANELRQAAHTIANLIYEQITGVEGYFLSRIAYVTVQQQGKKQRYRLHVSDYDGNNAQTIVSSSDPILSPAWSPDGEKLAYVYFDVNKGRTILRTHDLRTGKITDISSRAGINGAPAWSPDGKKLAMTLSYRGNPEIYVYTFATNKLKQLTFSGAIDTEAAWSPDGKHIAFTSDRGGKPQIYQMRADGSQTERLTFSGKGSQDATYSPDGKQLAMVQNTGNGFSIAIFDLNTNNARIVSRGPLDESPSFAPNGQAIIYAKQGGGNNDLATVSIDGKVRRELKQSGEVREPAWSPNGY